MHYYPFNPSAYLLSTSHWAEDRAPVECEASLLRDLAYRRLLDLYYGEEEPIPSKTRLVAIRIRMLRHEDIVTSVLREKFTLLDGVWRQKRADDEISKYQRKAATARENGKKGGRPTKDEPKKNPVGSKSVATRTRTRTIKSPLPPEGEVWWEEFWSTYPRKVAKPQALKAFAQALGRAPSFEAVMAGLKRHLGCAQWSDATKVPHPATWLNRDGWNDEVAVPPGAGDADKPGGWWASKQGLLDRGLVHGIPAPADESPYAFARFKAAIWIAEGDGPWVDDKDVMTYPMFKKMRNES